MPVCDFSMTLEGLPVSVPFPSVRETDEGREECHEIADTLSVTRCRRRFGAFHAEAVTLILENPGDHDSPLIGGLMDLDVLLPFEADSPGRAGTLNPEPRLRVRTAKGGMGHGDDFRLRDIPLPMGKTLRFAAQGGRSSQPDLPFFSLFRGDRGVMLAIGWTGSWFCDMTREKDGVRVRCGVAGVETVLRPGERIRTSQVLLMPYTGGVEEGHNRLRRLIRAHYTPDAVRAHPEGMLCMFLWGGMDSREQIRRIRRVKEAGLDFDLLWMDAGWYGHSREACPNEHEGDWAAHTGSWVPSARLHPDGLRDVSAAAEHAGMGFMLWGEPERARKGTDWPRLHPEYFLESPEGGENLLLNLGMEEARNFCAEWISTQIRQLNLRVWRQDFNMDPEGYWEGADEPRRRGMTQIRYVMGLYDLWDTLLQRFPGLLIDNCSSGGRRLDIETLSRSLAMWRTDYTCTWDCDPEMLQGMQGSISHFLPYSGATGGRFNLNTYALRSGCGSSYVFLNWGYEEADMEGWDWAWFRRAAGEYHTLAPYFSGDFYALIRPDYEKDTWTAWQYDRPDAGDGVILLFRRSRSPYASVLLFPRALKPGGVCRFEDRDRGETYVYSTDFIREHGLEMQIPHPGESRVLFYRRM